MFVTVGVCINLHERFADFRLVLHNMLEKIDTYLWAKRSPHMAPQVSFHCLRIIFYFGGLGFFFLHMSHKKITELTN